MKTKLERLYRKRLSAVDLVDEPEVGSNHSDDLSTTKQLSWPNTYPAGEPQQNRNDTTEPDFGYQRKIEGDGEKEAGKTIGGQAANYTYYKWINNDAVSIVGIPGFAFTSYSHAVACYGDVKDWSGKNGSLNLYMFSAPPALRVPFEFSSAMMDRSIIPAAVADVRAAINELLRKHGGYDFISLAATNKDDISKILGIAHKVGAIVSYHGGALADEAYCPRSTTMHKVDHKEQNTPNEDPDLDFDGLSQEKEAGGFGVSLNEIESPGASSWSNQEINDSYHDENMGEDVDLHLGEKDLEADVEAPYTDGLSPLSPMVDDDKKYDICRGATFKMSSLVKESTVGNVMRLFNMPKDVAEAIHNAMPKNDVAFAKLFYMSLLWDYSPPQEDGTRYNVSGLFDLTHLEYFMRECADTEDWLKNVVDLLNTSVKFSKEFNRLPNDASMETVAALSLQYTESKSSLTSEQAVLTFPDGFYWVPVNGEECKIEGAMMQHCGDPNAQMYSLRDTNNKPHVTIDVDNNQKILLQTRGKQNVAPSDTYIPYLQRIVQYLNIKGFYEHTISNDEIELCYQLGLTPVYEDDDAGDPGDEGGMTATEEIDQIFWIISNPDNAPDIIKGNIDWVIAYIGIDVNLEQHAIDIGLYKKIEEIENQWRGQPPIQEPPRQAQLEFTDRYDALGIDKPNVKTMCDGMCEGTGMVPVKQDEHEEPWKTLWDEAEAENPTDDGYHFVRCPDCSGSGKRVARYLIAQKKVEPNGTIIAIQPPIDTAHRIVGVIPYTDIAAEDLHVSLAYISDESVSFKKLIQIKKALEPIADAYDSIHCKIADLAAIERDGVIELMVEIDSSDFSSLRKEIGSALHNAGISCKTGDMDAHLSLSYNIKKLASKMKFITGDGDDIGQQVGRCSINDDVEGLQKIDKKIQAGGAIFSDWAESCGGEVIGIGGDEARIMVPDSAIDELEEVIKEYEDVTGFTISVGVGDKMSEADKALIIAKFHGKDCVVYYDSKMEDELDEAKEKVLSKGQEKSVRHYLASLDVNIEWDSSDLIIMSGNKKLKVPLSSPKKEAQTNRGWHPAFKNMETGEIIISPGFHNIELLPQEAQDAFNDDINSGALQSWGQPTGQWVSGFVTPEKVFYTRDETARIRGDFGSAQLYGVPPEHPSRDPANYPEFLKKTSQITCMAQHQPWIAVDLDGTLLEQGPSGSDLQPVKPGWIPLMQTWLDKGYRVSIYSARMTMHPDEQAQLEQYLQQQGVPYTEIYHGEKPPADIFVDDKSISGNDSPEQVGKLTQEKLLGKNVSDVTYKKPMSDVESIALIDTQPGGSQEEDLYTDGTEDRHDLSIPRDPGMETILYGH